MRVVVVWNGTAVVVAGFGMAPVVVGMWSQIGRAMMVPLLSQLLTTTVPVGPVYPILEVSQQLMYR